MTKSVDQVPFGLPILITVILLLLLAGLSIVYGSLLLIRRNRAEKEREEVWARSRTVVTETQTNTATTQVDKASDPNTFGMLIVQASGLLAKFCNKFETCQWFFSWAFKRDFNAANGCMVFYSLQYLSNRPLVMTGR
jgi:hypothetical protein